MCCIDGTDCTTITVLVLWLLPEKCNGSSSHLKRGSTRCIGSMPAGSSKRRIHRERGRFFALALAVQQGDDLAAEEWAVHNMGKLENTKTTLHGRQSRSWSAEQGRI